MSDATERFEAIAEHFFRATGMLAPGKSEAPEAASDPYRRAEMWEVFLAGRASALDVPVKAPGTARIAMPIAGDTFIGGPLNDSASTPPASGWLTMTEEEARGGDNVVGSLGHSAYLNRMYVRWEIEARAQRARAEKAEAAARSILNGAVPKILEFTARISDLERRGHALKQVLGAIDVVVFDAIKAWHADHDSRVFKLLAAIKGMPGIRVDLDDARARLAALEEG